MGSPGRQSAVGMLPRRLAFLPSRGFVGRASELRVLDELLDAVVDGQGPAGAVLAGEPGAGKTTLAAAAARAAAERGCHVSYGRGEDGIDTPFGPWRQALGPSWPIHEQDRAALFDAVCDHVDSAASDAPQVIVLDDLHWADRASLLLIAHVVATQPEGRLGLVLSYRTTETAPDSPLGALLATLAREPTMRRIELGGLAEADVEALLAEAGTTSPGEGDGAVARRIWSETRGNPFFVTARLDELEAGGASSSLQDVIGHRVARMGPDSLGVLRAAAVIGEAFSADVIASVAGLDEAIVVGVLDRAVRDGLVTEAPDDRLSFVHALVADTLLGGLTLTRRRELHRAAADELAARHTDPAVVARHLAEADPSDAAGREAAFDAAVAAGRAEMAALAYEDAATHLREALALAQRWDLDDDRRCTALLALTLAQARAGDPDEAARTFAPALELGVRLHRWDDVAAALLGFPRNASAVPDAALIAVLERAAAAAPASTPIRPLVLATLSWVLHYSEDPRRLRSLAEEAVALADEHGDPAVRARARSMLLASLGGDPDLVGQLEIVSALEELVRARGELSRGDAYELGLRRIHILFRMGRLADVDKEVQRLQPMAPARGRDSLRWWLLNLRAVRAFLAGRLEEGEALAATADDIAPHGDNANMSARLAHVATAAYLRGSLGDLCDALADVVSRFPLPAVRSVLVNALVSAGRHTEARELLHELARDGAAAIPRDDSWTTAAFMLADATRQLDARQDAEGLYRELLPHAGEFVVTSAVSAECFGPADRSLGQLALVCGWTDRAEKHLADAVRLCAQSGARPYLALARVEQAALGIPGAAEEARAIASDLGLGLVVQRLDAISARTAEEGAALVRDGDVWTASYAGRTVRLRDVRGLRYLHELLARPGQEIASVVLQGGVDASGTPMLDERAKEAYRRRLEDLDDELDEAERFGDTERAARATAEREAIAHELARSLGLGDRVRTSGSSSERARLNVSRALRSAIARIEGVHPELGAHLAVAVRTGTFCAYEPDPGLAISWVLE